MQLHITDAQNYDKKKDNSPILDKNGNQKYRSIIKTTEKGNERLTGFVYKPLKAGDVIEANIETEMYNGVPQLRFSIATNMRDAAANTQAGIDATEERKSQTMLLKSILEEIRTMNRNYSTDKMVQDIKGSSNTSEEYQDEDTLPTDFSDEFPIAEEDLPKY